ncbi:MAG: uncharacterized protein KVP18_003255 [Porospora cf. gigantea A]|uniref:uncharacterized protein n=1 Tax=Porospora cf. gigantea A TaxID=2853593 RepID=UPI00355A0F7F|nr:MAG: hypothetical protein KVP18_003255 [Porospora cf. gigantea A]
MSVLSSYLPVLYWLLTLYGAGALSAEDQNLASLHCVVACTGAFLGCGFVAEKPFSSLPGADDDMDECHYDGSVCMSACWNMKDENFLDRANPWFPNLLLDIVGEAPIEAAADLLKCHLVFTHCLWEVGTEKCRLERLECVRHIPEITVPQSVADKLATFYEGMATYAGSLVSEELEVGRLAERKRADHNALDTAELMTTLRACLAGHSALECGQAYQKDLIDKSADSLRNVLPMYT